MLTLADIISPLSTGNKKMGSDAALSGVVLDSREAKLGTLFVALRGEKVDGHQFVASAFKNGAIAALVEESIDGYATVDLRTSSPGSGQAISTLPSTPFCVLVPDTVTAMQEAATAWRARFDTRVIGITGSVGKSSTKELVASVLAQKYKTFKSPGNRNSILGLPPALFDLRPFHQRAVLEMGMYVRGEIARLCEMTQPSIGVVTIIGPVHLERAGSMENIVIAKRELVESLPTGGTAVLNKDDARVMSMAAHTKANIFTYGLDKTADLWASDIQSRGLRGMRFTLHHQGESFNLLVPLIGRHSVHTALRAAAVGLVEGLRWEQIIAGLDSNSAQLRLVAVPGPNGSIIIDDTYNSSPDSAMAALNLLNDLPGRKIAVLGDMLELGDAEEESHRLVGRRAATVADLLITVGQRGRLIGEEALTVGMRPTRVFALEGVNEATEKLAEIALAGDMILIKGSLGMGMSRMVSALEEG